MLLDALQALVAGFDYIIIQRNSSSAAAFDPVIRRIQRAVI
jgi:hypothetical protein